MQGQCLFLTYSLRSAFVSSVGYVLCSISPFGTGPTGESSVLFTCYDLFVLNLF